MVVGESSRLETAITITGLKHAHFYNVRVIAVGSNNFQAGSRVIRLRTYARDGRPLLGGRSESLTSNCEGDSSDGEMGRSESHGVGIESASIPKGTPVLTRESSGNGGQHSGHQGQRKPTSIGSRKTSAAADHPTSPIPQSLHQSEDSMQQLTERFETIRKETEDVLAQSSHETEEFKTQWDELVKERDEKRQSLKEREEASEKLKKEVHSSEHANRQAQNRKAQKEKLLREKQAEVAKMQEDIGQWQQEIESMKSDEEEWSAELEKLVREREVKSEELRATIRQRQKSINGLEEIIRDKGLQIKELEEERKNLPGYQEDEESRKRVANDKRRESEWDTKEREWSVQLHKQDLQFRSIQVEYVRAQSTLSALRARQDTNVAYTGSSSGVEFNSVVSQAKVKARRSRNRKSRTNTMSSIATGLPTAESPLTSTIAYNNINATASPGFAQGPYFDMSNNATISPQMVSNMAEADITALTAGAPLSPTASSLLPSNIFSDDESSASIRGPDMHPGASPFAHDPSSPDSDPHSPASSSRSASLISSPRTSAHNVSRYGVAGRDHNTENDRRWLNSPRSEFVTARSPSGTDPSSSQKNFGGFFSFPKNRGRTTEDGPALGSLNQTQSQSFPNSTEDVETNPARPRRISFSSGWNVSNFLTRSPAPVEALEGNAPAPARNLGNRRRRGFGMFGQSLDDPSSLYSDRSPSSPRPLSIASDLPRPSTESAPFGWPVTSGGMRDSHLATDWSVNARHSWNNNMSRRTNTLPTSHVATADDVLLPRGSVHAQSSPPPVGVIGTRPSSSHKPETPKLNPAAPTFKAMFSRGSRLDKDLSMDNAEQTTFTEDPPPSTSSSSPNEPRKSRDTPSIHTQDSIADSADSLEQASSNHSDTFAASSMPKDKESSFRQLLRKGSSSKFGFSSKRSRDSGLFSGKRGGGSSANSDRNDSRDGGLDDLATDSSALGRSLEGVTSSPAMSGLSPESARVKESPNLGGMQSKGVNWGRAWGKKKKGRESSDVERSEAETTGTEDEV